MSEESEGKGIGRVSVFTVGYSSMSTGSVVKHITVNLEGEEERKFLFRGNAVICVCVVPRTVLYK